MLFHQFLLLAQANHQLLLIFFGVKVWARSWIGCKSYSCAEYLKVRVEYQTTHSRCRESRKNAVHLGWPFPGNKKFEEKMKIQGEFLGTASYSILWYKIIQNKFMYLYNIIGSFAWILLKYWTKSYLVQYFMSTVTVRNLVQDNF